MKPPKSDSKNAVPMKFVSVVADLVKLKFI